MKYQYGFLLLPYWLICVLSYGIPVTVVSAGLFADVKPSSVSLSVMEPAVRDYGDQAVRLVPCGEGCANLE